MRLECKVNFVEQYGKYLSGFVSERQKDFKKLKAKIENAEWNDEVYSAVVADINEVTERIAVALDLLLSASKFIEAFVRDMDMYITTRNGFDV